MKKIIILISILILSFEMGRANSLTISNMTLSTLTFSITSTGGNCAASITLPPNTTLSYSSPADIADLAGCGATASDKFEGIYGFCNPYDIAVHSPQLMGGGMQYQEIMANNGCTSTGYMLITWVPGAGSSDGTIFINE